MSNWQIPIRRFGRILTSLFLLAGCRLEPRAKPLATPPADAHIAVDSARSAVAAVAIPTASTAVFVQAPEQVLEHLGESTASVGHIGRFGATLGQGALSRSIGTAQSGWLQGGVALEESAVVRQLEPNRRKGHYWATGELVSLLQRSAAAVAAEFPGSVMRFGNLSRAGGGDMDPSVSHNSGRDADVIFYGYDRMGAERQPDCFVHYDENGLSDAPSHCVDRFEFDTARNWALVRHWLSDPSVVVQWIFVAVPLRNRLLDYALRQGEPASLRQRALRVLVQPRDSSPHADHFHLRIACPPGDRPACLDGGGQTSLARAAQVDALLEMYWHGSPAEQRYARELLSLPVENEGNTDLPPIEGGD